MSRLLMHQSCQQLVASRPFPWSPTPRAVTKSHPAHQKLPTQNIIAMAIPIIQRRMERIPQSMAVTIQLLMHSLSKIPR